MQSNDAVYSALSSPYVTSPFEEVNYGTQPELRSGDYEDFDWDEDRMVTYNT